MQFCKTYIYPVRIQFEDVDAGGVLHHPAYLRLLERGRSEAMIAEGYPFDKFIAGGHAFVVAEILAKYLIPAKLYQEVSVLTRAVALRKSSMKIHQTIVAGKPDPQHLEEAQDDLSLIPNTLFSAQLRMVCVNLKTLKPASLPADYAEFIKLPADEFFEKNPEKRQTGLVLDRSV